MGFLVSFCTFAQMPSEKEQQSGKKIKKNHEKERDYDV